MPNGFQNKTRSPQNIPTYTVLYTAVFRESTIHADFRDITETGRAKA